MIKATLITLGSAGLLGTGLTALTPQSVKISTGAMVLEIDKDGFSKSRSDDASFGITVTGRGDGEFTLKL